MNHCATCKHFTQQSIMGSETKYGVCTNEAFFEMEGMLTASNGMKLGMDDPYTDLWMEVGPDFGCVKHEAKA